MSPDSSSAAVCRFLTSQLPHGAVDADADTFAYVLGIVRDSARELCQHEPSTSELMVDLLTSLGATNATGLVESVVEMLSESDKKVGKDSTKSAEGQRLLANPISISDHMNELSMTAAVGPTVQRDPGDQPLVGRNCFCCKKTMFISVGHRRQAAGEGRCEDPRQAGPPRRAQADRLRCVGDGVTGRM